MIASICIEKSEEWETGPRYLTMDTLEKNGDEQQDSSSLNSTSLPATIAATPVEPISNPILQKKI